MVKAVQVNSFGNPASVIEIIDIELTPIGHDDVLVDLIASTINPSDIYRIQGLYPIKSKLPAIFGSEGIAKVIELGENVTNVKTGDRIMLPLGSKTWQEQLIIHAKGLIPLPDGDPLQLAMIGINPPTALVMLTDFVDLKEGDWIMQNAANSAVGRYIITLAKSMNLKTVNIVRRESLIQELKDLGADVVVLEGPNCTKQVIQETNNAEIKLGIDAIAGLAANQMASSLAKNGLILSYGALSGENIQLAMGVVMSKNLTLQSFWLAHWFTQTNRNKIKETYEKLIGLIATSELYAKIDSTYKIEDAKNAILHAMKDGREGKILLTGPAF